MESFVQGQLRSGQARVSGPAPSAFDHLMLLVGRDVESDSLPGLQVPGSRDRASLLALEDTPA